MTYEIGNLFDQKSEVTDRAIGAESNVADIAIRDDPTLSPEIKEAIEATGMVIKDRGICYHLDELDEEGEDLEKQILADADRELLKVEPILHPKLGYLSV